MATVICNPLGGFRQTNRTRGQQEDISAHRGYDQVGRKTQARREFERLYADDPGFEDLRERLGLGE